MEINLCPVFLNDCFSLSHILYLCLSGLFETLCVRTSQGKWLIIYFFNEKKEQEEGKITSVEVTQKNRSWTALRKTEKLLPTTADVHLLA